MAATLRARIAEDAAGKEGPVVRLVSGREKIGSALTASFVRRLGTG